MRSFLSNLFFAVIVLSSSFALAGTLFPPEGSNGVNGCPGNDQMLRWTCNGSDCVVKCVDPSPYISTQVNGQQAKCAEGQFLVGIQNGAPLCADGSGDAKLPNIDCPAGLALTGIQNGQPVCKSFAQTVTCPSGKAINSINNGTPVCVSISGGSSTPTPTPTPASCVAGGTSYSSGSVTSWNDTNNCVLVTAQCNNGTWSIISTTGISCGG